MSTIVTQNPPAPAGGDGIGLSITVSSNQQESNGNENCNIIDNETPELTDLFSTRSKNGTSPSFIPPSVNPSPIPFDDDDDDVDDDDGNTYTTSNEIGPPSIMREPSHLDSQPQQQQIFGQASQAHTEVLEERVRDLEEKLSTLSMLLMQQNQNQRHSTSPKSQSHQPSSPGSYDDSCSLSPPTTPFRSLSSFATIRSSNVPVLESPTPISRRYRGSSNNNISSSNHQDALGDFYLPYEHRSPKQKHNRNLSRGIRNNLSYHILHAPDSELDTRNPGLSSDDGGSSIGNQTDDSFEKAYRVPTLDSLPGSSRTSPILSKDPIVAGILSPIENDQLDGSQASTSVSSSVDKANSSSTPEATQDSPTAHQNAETLQVSETKDSSNRTSSNNNNNNNNSLSEISNSETTKHKKKKSNIKSKWLDYLNSVQDSNYDTDKQMEEFVKVPSKVEALLSFGFWISVDSFLYTLTMLPLRFVYSILLLVISAFKRIVGRETSGTLQFHRHNSYHLIQVSIIYIIYACVLKPINISIMYHMIRSQSMFKLYLLVAMVEVFDRLLCSLGQDCFDSLYWNTTRRPRSSRLLVSVLLVLVYTALHSLLLFVHVATLNVAMNSDDQALLSLMIGGNFAEIKSTVFKKYNKATLFKITASDICERFKLALFLFLVLMLNASQGMDQKMYYNYLSMCGIVVGGEWLSDWLKHAFITKFNYIASSVYGEYSLLLAGDVSGFGHEGGENLDKSHAVVRRLGLAQIPLVCVMAKYLKESYKYQAYGNEPPKWFLVIGMLSVWLMLLMTKLSLASLLQRMCKNKLEAAPEFSKNNATVAKKKNHRISDSNAMQCNTAK